MATSPRAFTARHDQSWTGHVAVLAPGAIPTVDFYVTPRLIGLSSGSVHRFDSRAWDPSSRSLPAGTFVVVVRHASGPWLRFLAKQAGQWSGVAFLMDDDLPAAWRCRELPLDYRLRTSGRFLRVGHGLSRVCDQAWVSTEVLRSRYPDWHPSLVPPLNPFAIRGAASHGTRRWCYHGTRAHMLELNWLRPVVEAVQARVPDAEFEVTGGAAVRRLFAGIPRVRVLAPMPWREYAAYCERSELAVGLAPLLPSPFNDARAHVKAFDIAHCGAVGIFSRRAPYVPALDTAGATYCGDSQAEWIDRVTHLLTDDAQRMALYSRTADWQSRQRPAPSLQNLVRSR